MKQHSTLQHIFWLIAGSEIHTLVECKNDYNRHASIGFVLFMTTVFASIAGFSAGYFFSNGNITASIGFALLWAFLIYAIDRSMVVSLKKKEEIELLPFREKAKYYVIPFLARALVGVMIGFFMSIPLEIIVFKDNIKLQIDKEDKDKILSESGFVKTIGGVEQKSGAKKEFEAEKKQIDSLLNGGCPDPEFISNMTSYNNCKPSLDNKYDTYKTALDNFSGIKKFIDEDKQFLNSDYEPAKRRRDNAWEDYNSAKRECNAFYLAAKTISDKWKKDLNNNKRIADSTSRALGKDILNISQKADTAATKKKNQLEGLNGFTRQYEALTHSANEPNNGSLLFLLWLIRLIFIAIEILPTLTKLMTPIGDYDRAIEAGETEFVYHLDASKKIKKSLEENRIKSEVETADEINSRKKELEIELNSKILEEIARVQSEVANSVLSEWEKQEKERAATKVTDFIKTK